MAAKLARGQLVAIEGLTEPASPPAAEDFAPSAEGGGGGGGGRSPEELNGQLAQLLEHHPEAGLWTVATFGACLAAVPEACLRALGAEGAEELGVDVVLGPASDPGAVGATLAEALGRGGHAVCRLFVSPADLRDMVSTSDRLAEQGAFARLPKELEQGYLGRGGSGKALALDLDAKDLADFVKASALGIAESAIDAVGEALRPHCFESLGFEAHGRSTTMLALPLQGEEEELYEAPDLENDDAAGFLMLQWRAKVAAILNAGPCSVELNLQPKHDDEEDVALSLRPGTLAVFATDRYRFSYEPEGKALTMLAFYLDRPQPYTINNIHGDLTYLVGALSGPPPPSAREQLPVVAMATRYPFGADEPWKLFFGYAKAGFDVQTRHPYARWEVDMYYEKDADPMTGKSYTCHGSFMEGVELFDCKFFDISPAEARGMDPTQKHVLEVSYIALKGAGYTKQGLISRATNIGAFIGLDKNEWRDIPKDQCGGFGASNSANAITANRFNYCLNLRGASMTIDTACSSSLVAQHTAKLYLRYKDYDPCECVIACGVNLSLSPLSYIACCAAGMHSHVGRCFTYNNSADGYARGEAVGATATKLKAWDREAGDFALMAGSHVNQDGRSASLTAPSGPAQERCSRAVMKELGIKSREIDTTECHGTGTALGDPIEIGAYRKVMGADPRDEPVVITTSKSNIGHCEGSAGIGGFLKTLLMCMYGEGTPNCHFNQLNGHLDMDGFPGIITTEGVPFRGEASYNSVLSFGFGGTNASATVWGPNCMTSRALSCKDMYSVVSQRLRAAPVQTVAMPSDDWEDWEIDFPARDWRPTDIWDVEFDDDGGALFTRRDRTTEDFGSEYVLSGTFNGWGETPMEADGDLPSLHAAVLELGPSGAEEFQVHCDGDPAMAFFPEVPHCTRKSTQVRGPSAADRASAWRISGSEGDRYRVELHVSAHSVSVTWTKER